MRRYHLLPSAASLAALTLLSLSAVSCSQIANALASPTSGTGSSAASSYSATALEQQVYAKINDYRVSRGMSVLAWNDAVAAQARQHSSNMANGLVAFGHDGFNDRVNAIAQALAISSAAENLAMSSGLSDPAGTVVNGWLGSASHKPHIEGDFDVTGVGVAIASNGSIYFNQMFAKLR
jgi:uncharacterized protein YkwD